MQFVNSAGKAVATFGVTPAQEGEKKKEGKRELGGMTQEYEIMRGDLVRLLYEESIERNRRRTVEETQGEGKGNGKGSLKYEFGKTVTSLHQTSKDGVDILFSDNSTGHFDLVVAADGQASRTRELAFGKAMSDAAFVPFGLYAAFYSIPSLPVGSDDMAKAYNAPGRKVIMTRTGGRPVTQVYLLDALDTTALQKIHGESTAVRKEKWAAAFQGAGWESEALIEGMKGCEDFYVAEGGIVRNKRLHTGRVVLLGESGYGGTFTGSGTELALSGAWVLAGELARHGSDVGAALQRYEEIMRTPVKELHATPSMVKMALRMFLPYYAFEVWLLRTFVWAIHWSGIALLIARLMPDGKEGWKLPEYKELGFEE